MDNSAVRNKWMDREALENYRHAMRICCMNALHVCSDEALSELCYDLDISRNGDARAYEHLLGGQCMVITSEPGGGKSYLMWLLLRDYLEDCRDDSDRLPVLTADFILCLHLFCQMKWMKNIGHAAFIFLIFMCLKANHHGFFCQ